ncbi:hypothetical protein DM02DRAFT_611054 [Periconia macrospinosa]|uniref:Rhodopsin domain-containing protein n=1 Tax=Periconia macrospinosa TaxID=97972 RepID=A0A2V1E329_9PLEO|nr:hypothetical protein DM02DRAFT_611054 [Periconia macrospinosa]
MEILYIATTTFTKLSILTFYRRMSSSAINSPFLIIVWISIVFVGIYGIVSIMVIMFTCAPVEAYWYRSSKEWTSTHKFKCREELLSIIVIVIISAFQDLLACILPMTMIRKLRLPFRQKLGLCAIFGMGLATCALGIVRVQIAVQHLSLRSVPTYDAAWEGESAWTPTCIEANLGIICASAPALKAYCKCLEGRQQDPEFGWYHRTLRTHSSSGTSTLIPLKPWRSWFRDSPSA